MDSNDSKNDSTNDSKKNAKIYECNLCDFRCSKKSNFFNHLNTRKHKTARNDSFGTAVFQKNATPYMCSCGKKYVHQSNLYRHQHKCKKNEENEEKNEEKNEEIDISNTQITGNITNNLILKLVQENTEIKSMLFKQFETIQDQQKQVQTENKELRNQINELIPRVGNTVNTTINKQKFNINIFLNEQCKDALTINEFIDKIKVTLDDLMITKNKGLCEGVSNIFIENMNKLSVYERPIHCTDAKRETVYINSEGGPNTPHGWSKDEENKNLKMAINKVSHVQRQNMDKWIEEHPNWENNSDEQEEYLRLVKSCTDDFKEDKVIKKLCNNIYLNNEIL